MSTRFFLLRPGGVVGMLATAALLVVGCSEDVTKPKPQPEPHARSTLAGTIAFFAQAHKDEDIEDYIECLHPDYEFWFSEDDRTDPNWDWTDWVEIAEDLEVTESMFEAESITDIRVTFTNLTPDPDSLGLYIEQDESEDIPFTFFWGIMAVDMHVVEQTSVQENDHWVDGRAYIYLRADPQDSTLWTIWKIEDRGNVHKSTEVSSWSEVKSLFRK